MPCMSWISPCGKSSSTFEEIQTKRAEIEEQARQNIQQSNDLVATIDLVKQKVAEFIRFNARLPFQPFATYFVVERKLIQYNTEDVDSFTPASFDPDKVIIPETLKRELNLKESDTELSIPDPTQAGMLESSPENRIKSLNFSGRNIISDHDALCKNVRELIQQVDGFFESLKKFRPADRVQKSYIEDLQKKRDHWTVCLDDVLRNLNPRTFLDKEGLRCIFSQSPFKSPAKPAEEKATSKVGVVEAAAEKATSKVGVVEAKVS